MATLTVECSCGCGEEADVEFTFTYVAGEAPTRDYPGSPEELETEGPESVVMACGTVVGVTREQYEYAAERELEAQADGYDEEPEVDDREMDWGVDD